jgi:hypothetical protein
MTCTRAWLVLLLLPLACGERSDDGSADLGADASDDIDTQASSGASSDTTDAADTSSTDADTDASSTDADTEASSTDADTEASSTDTDASSTDAGSTDADADASSTDADTDASSTDADSTTSEGESTTTTGDPPSFDACGFADDDGPWVEIEYWQLGSISSPSYTYSDTPGWGEPEWAAANMSWPEIWEFGGNSMSNDPIGIVASISGTWQMMIGLQGLAAYDSATVCVEGRSISVGSNAIFDVYNPANGCGVEAQISNSWDVHAVGVELGDCLIPGVETQAVRIEPTGGSGVVGLVRVRVTLHGAVY